MATFAYVQYAHRKRSRRGRTEAVRVETAAGGGLGSPAEVLALRYESGGLFAVISLELWRALRLRLCGIADRLSQHLAQLRLCLCRFPFGWLPLSHTSYVGMLEAQLNPFSSRELAMAQQGGAHVGNIGMYYAAYRLSQQCWNVMPTGRNARGVDPLIYGVNAHICEGIQVTPLSKRSPVPLGRTLDGFMGD